MILTVIEENKNFPRKKEMNVHRCRFIEWTPNSIKAMCFSPDNRRLCLVRGDSTIEIWNSENAYYNELVMK